MSDLVLYREEVRGGAIALPQPRLSIRIRPAAASDLPFIDDLQRQHSRMVGWFPTRQLETNIKQGKLLIAEETPGTPVGYCISSDRYFKRDDCGIVYQLNVAPMKQRGLVGAALVKTVFERAAYGCKLFCCWCAQDLEANHFWESIGFVPLAFRTGSRRGGKTKEPRIHIFWQRRIREGDAETPYWFPSETSGGAVRESRLVLPIPPGTHWSDAKPAVLPGMEKVGQQAQLEGGEKPKRRRKPKAKQAAPPSAAAGGLWFAPPKPPEPTAAEKKAQRAKERAEKPRPKNDPKLVAAVRELRDRYIEQINEGLLLPPAASGKYDVSRALADAPSAMQTDGAVTDPHILDAA
jgi:N-acetylglutamate synthase-like GNAT family acetyltransferase